MICQVKEVREAFDEDESFKIEGSSKVKKVEKIKGHQLILPSFSLASSLPLLFTFSSTCPLEATSTRLLE